MSADNSIIVISENGDSTKKQIKTEDLFHLEEVNWMVNVTPMSDSHRDSIESRAILQLKATDQNSRSSTTVMDLKLPELTKFYETLEKIQDKLDNLVEVESTPK